MFDSRERTLYNVGVHSLDGCGQGSLRVYFGRLSRKGLFLYDGEAAAGGLFGEALVYIGHDLFECGAVESLAQN